MTAPTILAIDPGGQRCGIVLRRGNDYGGHLLLERIAPAVQPLDRWAHFVASKIAEISVFTADPDIIAVESVVEPTPQMGTIAVRGLLETAVVYGAIVGWFKGNVVSVRPQGFSKTATQPKRVLQQLFPEQLLVAPLPQLKDVRAAWLIAEAATRQRRFETAS